MDITFDFIFIIIFLLFILSQLFAILKIIKFRSVIKSDKINTKEGEVRIKRLSLLSDILFITGGVGILFYFLLSLMLGAKINLFLAFISTFIFLCLMFMGED